MNEKESRTQNASSPFCRVDAALHSHFKDSVRCCIQTANPDKSLQNKSNLDKQSKQVFKLKRKQVDYRSGPQQEDAPQVLIQPIDRQRKDRFQERRHGAKQQTEVNSKPPAAETPFCRINKLLLVILPIEQKKKSSGGGGRITHDSLIKNASEKLQGG